MKHYSSDSSGSGCCLLGGCLHTCIVLALNLALINTIVWGAKIGVNQAQLSNAKTAEKSQTEIKAIMDKCDNNLTFQGWLKAIPNAFKGR